MKAGTKSLVISVLVVIYDGFLYFIFNFIFIAILNQFPSAGPSLEFLLRVVPFLVAGGALVSVWGALLALIAQFQEGKRRWLLSVLALVFNILVTGFGVVAALALYNFEIM